MTTQLILAQGKSFHNCATDSNAFRKTFDFRHVGLINSLQPPIFLLTGIDTPSPSLSLLCAAFLSLTHVIFPAAYLSASFSQVDVPLTMHTNWGCAVRVGVALNHVVLQGFANKLSLIDCIRLGYVFWRQYHYFHNFIGHRNGFVLIIPCLVDSLQYDCHCR